jgi:hypothetical protein
VVPSWIVLACVAGAVLPVAAAGQLVHVVTGRIADAGSGAGIPTAWLEVTGTDRRLGVAEDGSFTVSLADGTYELHAHALGYRSTRTRVRVAADTTLTLTLEAEPIALEAIRVEADRLSRRARAVPWSVRTIGRDDIIGSAAATTVDLLEQRRLQVIPCGGRECVRWRGAPVEPVVCIDEHFSPGGLAELRSYPMESLYVVEVHDRGRMIRVYTTWFVERMRAGDVALRSVLRIGAPAC